MSVLISHPLSNNALHRPNGSFGIRNIKLCPLIVPEVEFSKVALQMMLRHMVIGASDATLEGREVRLDTIGVRVTANIFLNAVVDGLMPGKITVHVAVLACVISDQGRPVVDLRHQDRAQGLGIHTRHMLRVNAAVLSATSEWSLKPTQQPE